MANLSNEARDLIYEHLTTKEQFRQAILIDIVDGGRIPGIKHPFLGYSKEREAGNTVGNIIKLMRDEPKRFHQHILNFEEAGLEMILDQETATGLTWYGKQPKSFPAEAFHTVGQFIARKYLIESPHIHNWIEWVMESVKYDDIIEKRITGDEDLFKYQEFLLDFLSGISTKDNPGKDYWKGIEANPSFVWISWANNLKYDKERAESFLPGLFKLRYEECQEKDPSDYDMMVWNLCNETFRGELATDRVLHDRNGELRDKLIKKRDREDIYQPTNVVVEGKEVVAFLNSEFEDRYANVDYVFVTHEGLRRDTAVVNVGEGTVENAPSEFKDKFLAFVPQYAYFKRNLLGK